MMMFFVHIVSHLSAAVHPKAPKKMENKWKHGLLSIDQSSLGFDETKHIDVYFSCIFRILHIFILGRKNRI